MFPLRWSCFLKHSLSVPAASRLNAIQLWHSTETPINGKVRVFFYCVYD